MIKSLLLLSLMIGSFFSVAYSINFSEAYLSSKQQADFFDYKIDTSIEQSNEINLNLNKRYPDIYNENQKAIERVQELEKSEGWKGISAYVKPKNEDEITLGWDSPPEYDAPIIYHKGDLVIDQTVVIDYPLLVEGNLTIKGNLILKNPVPVFVLGSINAKHLLYMLGVDNNSNDPSLLFVKGKINLSGYAFLEGVTATFDTKITAKNIYSLYTSSFILKMFWSKNSKINPALFPTDARLIRPSIIEWKGDLDNEMLSTYLERDKEPFITPPENFKPPSKQPWQYYLEHWKNISDSILKPEIAGATVVKYKNLKFKEDQSDIPRSQGLVLADMRTGKGFCVYSQYDLPPYIEDEEAFKKGVGKPELVLYKSVNDVSSSTCDLINRYQNIEYLMRDNNSLDYLPEAHLNFYSKVNNKDEDFFNKLYQKDKPFLDKDPYIATYWLTHFGIVLDDRLDEVLLEAKKQDHPLVKSAISFYTDKPFDLIYQYAGLGAYEANESLFSGKYKTIKTGNDIFKKNHSDLIHVYYRSNQLRKISSLKAMLYSLNNDHSQRDIDKAKLLADIADDLNAWEDIPFPKSSSHPLAWQYLSLRNPKEKADDQQNTLWLSEYFKRSELMTKTSIPIIKSLHFKDKHLLDKYITQVTQLEKQEDVLKLLGLDDEYKKKQVKKAVYKLITGKNNTLIQTLLTNKQDEKLALIISSVLDYIGDHDKESYTYDLNTMISFVDFAVEHQLADYDIESTLQILSIKDKSVIQAWAKKKLNKPRLLWANTHYDYGGISGIINYVELLRKWGEN